MLFCFVFFFHVPPSLQENAFENGQIKSPRSAIVNAEKLVWMPQKHQLHQLPAWITEHIQHCQVQNNQLWKVCGLGDVHWTFTNKPLQSNHFSRRRQPCLHNPSASFSSPGEKRSFNTAERKTSYLQGSANILFSYVSTTFMIFIHSQVQSILTEQNKIIKQTVGQQKCVGPMLFSEN